jgi:hypothetical protein
VAAGRDRGQPARAAAGAQRQPARAAAGAQRLADRAGAVRPGDGGTAATGAGRPAEPHRRPDPGVTLGAAAAD